MKTKEGMYAIIGGCVGAVMTMVVCSFFPIGAQSQGEHVFGEITCTALKVINAENNEIISLGSNPKFGHALVHLKDGDGNIVNGLILAAGDGGSITSLSRNRGMINISHKAHGGEIYLSSEGDGGYVKLGIGKGGAEIGVYDQEGSTSGSAIMDLSTHGGRVIVLGKGGKEAGGASITADESGGWIGLEGKGKQGGGVEVVIDRNGGKVAVFGKGSRNSRAAMGVTEYGDGALTTWDKNGYRLQ